MRNLAGEISSEFQHREEQDADVKDLLNLVSQIVPYHMSHNAEPDAVDLLLEVEKLEWLAQYVDDKNYSRTCLYLVSCCAYLAEPDDTAVLRTAYDLYIKCSKYVDAMRIALRMNNHELILSTMTSCPDKLHKKQLAFLLARHGVLLMYEEEEEDAMEDAPQVRVLALPGTAHMTPVMFPHNKYQKSRAHQGLSAGLAVNVCDTSIKYSFPACWSLQAVLMALTAVGTFHSVCACDKSPL